MESIQQQKAEKSGPSNSVEEPYKHAQRKKPVTKNYVLSPSISVNCPERSTVWRQKADQGCLGLEDGVEIVCRGAGGGVGRGRRL